MFEVRMKGSEREGKVFQNTRNICERKQLHKGNTETNNSVYTDSL